ncbi:MAG: response regulator [Halobacteriovoraceae bacterium]|nr:response regulator [Halobacteriovoraceae bacterium]
MNTLNPKDVLIVDDEKDICEICSMYFEKMGIFRNICMAHDGIQATKMLDNQKFEIIILDINLPKKDGVKIVQQFGHIPKNLKESVIVISGNLDAPILKEVMKNGVKNFLVKPFDEKSFITKVAEVLKQVEVARRKKKVA